MKPATTPIITTQGLRRDFQSTRAVHNLDLNILPGELFGLVGPEDKLIYSYQSPFTLEQVIKKMMEFSNNFVANQITIALGAHVHGPPGTLDKGVRVIKDYAAGELGLKDVEIVEGSGVSRENLISAAEMKTVLDAFKPHRYLLKREGKMLYKTGTLKDIRTQVGYLEDGNRPPCSFVVFLNKEPSKMESLISCITALKNTTTIAE